MLSGVDENLVGGSMGHLNNYISRRTTANSQLTLKAALGAVSSFDQL